MQESVRQVTIKGIRDGLLVSAAAASFAELQALLTAELQGKQDFLVGSRIALALNSDLFNRDQLSELQSFFDEQGLKLWAVLTDNLQTRAAARELGLAIRLPGSNTDLDGNVLAADAAASGDLADADLLPVGSHAGSSGGLLLRETVRSGRSVYHEGHVVIIGDVNPGAEIIAGGDVVVWGKLRGLVHAGALGDHTAVICALELIPTQLRIADQIAISPAERQARPVPEKAALKNGQIVARAWPAR